jgi:CO/xanthine dehydrogenase FAD-binding subunit
MKPIPVDVVRPRELGEALAVLSRFGSDARVLAGGQSLLPLLNLRYRPLDDWTLPDGAVATRGGLT